MEVGDSSDAEITPLDLPADEGDLTQPQSQLMAPALHWQTAAATHPGCVRTLNEDAYFAGSTQGIWCVADGMGGHAAGDRAAAMLVDALSGIEAADGLDESLQRLQSAVMQVNDALSEEEFQAEAGGTCGSTLVALVLAGSECACVWAGDSRLYLCRDQGLYQMSHDHSLVQELVDQRLIEDHEARWHPRRHVITRAVGAESNLELDLIYFSVQAGDQLLLCSDGLHCELDADTILEVLVQQSGCEQKVNQLIEQALACGARDNVTVNLIEVHAA